MLELDILLNEFLDIKHASLNEEQMQLFDLMLDYPDQVLFDLLMGNMLPSSQAISCIVNLINTRNMNNR